MFGVLKDVANPMFALLKRRSYDRRLAIEAEQPSKRREHRRFTRAVGPDHRDEVSGSETCTNRRAAAGH